MSNLGTKTLCNPEVSYLTIYCTRVGEVDVAIHLMDFLIIGGYVHHCPAFLAMEGYPMYFEEIHI